MPKPGTNKKIVNPDGTINLKESEECLYPIEGEREQISIFCPISSPEPYDLETSKPKVYKALKSWAEEHCPNYLVMMYPEGYDQALIWEKNDEEDAENDIIYTVFICKKVIENSENKTFTIDDLEDVEDIDTLLKESTGENLFVYRADPGNLRELIISQATVIAEINLKRDSEIFE